MTKMPSRRAAFWLCYVAILVGSSSPLFAQQTCPGTCLVAQDCQCVGEQCVDCFWLGEYRYCYDCDLYWGMKSYAVKSDSCA